MKRALSVVAILAIALHAVVWAAIPFAAAQAAAADPFSVICHSGGGDQNSETPAQSPSRVCDHCNVCAVFAAGGEPDGVLAGHVVPARVLHRLEPSPAAARREAAGPQRLPRGPPQTV